ncbi:tRNA uridine-5-carboxymethylaminomethyl(34) synthesis GTPase MnmE [Rhodoferax sp.]|uniref:tRNA uridine-5-carboxymethylaminomethyl(34) synthesis GTPase MnmE n=1 Tax=Rhodoferax sp. TaxID=50421 RepID=UPI0025DB8406|nr:tRNA uridine-5-carboxymethylaminomethyl(34) synthesis GTPase MnmE [Rhodoferax sp.]
MLSRHTDPIAAIATASGRGAVGIVRVSGKSLAAFVGALLGRALRPREATYLPFPDAQGQPIDHGLALFFPGPHSFTGEDVLELQAHGGPVVLQLLLARCLELASKPVEPRAAPLLPSLRLADPGEFTQRAFLNNKLDLAQAEAIADLIDASTEAAARSASQSLSGAFSKEVVSLRDALIHLRMLVEATLDFPEEEIDFLEKADAVGQLQRLQISLRTVQAKATQGALLREGMKVVIAGQPNAGKSSLLNALAGAELAIVTPIAGTTRDKVQETIQIEGVPLHIIDTAGLRESDDEVEQIGIARAWEAIASADALVFLHDLTRQDAPEYIAADAGIAGAIAQKVPSKVPVIHVWNKADANPRVTTTDGIVLSAKTGAGLDALRARLLAAAGWQPAQGGTFIARQRHLQALQEVSDHLENASELLASGGNALDLLAEELRLGQNALNRITGAFGADDLLGVIFSKFCIGK